MDGVVETTVATPGSSPPVGFWNNNHRVQFSHMGKSAAFVPIVVSTFVSLILRPSHNPISLSNKSQPREVLYQTQFKDSLIIFTTPAKMASSVRAFPKIKAIRTFVIDGVGSGGDYHNVEGGHWYAL